MRSGAGAGRARDASHSPEKRAESEGERILLLLVCGAFGRCGHRGAVSFALAVSDLFYRSIRGGFDRVRGLVHHGLAETRHRNSKFQAPRSREKPKFKLQSREALGECGTFIGINFY